MNKKEKYKTKHVFTPGTTAKLTFVKRSTINERLVNALTTPGIQVIVYGPTGSGKTTLIARKLEQLYPDHVVTNCMGNMTFEQLVIDAFQKLNRFYVAEKSSEKQKKISASLSSEYVGIKARIGGDLSHECATKEVPVLPPQLTPHALGRLLGSAECCWVLDDFHKVAKSEKVKLAQLLKVYKDMADDYPGLKIIGIGTVHTAREVVRYETSMRTRVAEINVPLMNNTELGQIISIGEGLLNIRFSQNVRHKIIDFSNNFATVCHKLCLNLCNSSGVEETQGVTRRINKKILSQAFWEYVQDSSDSLKAIFEEAIGSRSKMSTNYRRLILYVIGSSAKKGLTFNEILDSILQEEPGYTSTNTKRYLTELQSDKCGNLLRFEPISNQYRFADPFYKVYAQAYFECEQEEAMSIESFYKLQRKVLKKFDKKL